MNQAEIIRLLSTYCVLSVVVHLLIDWLRSSTGPGRHSGDYNAD
jgi:hypothetical protein